MQPRTYPTAALGYRVLRADLEGRLHSLFSPYVWKDGINVASCDQKLATYTGGKGAPTVHEAPHSECVCGFYAYHDYQLALTRVTKSNCLNLVVAAVAAKGQLEIHTAGWRAAEVQLLALSDVADRYHQLQERYRIPLLETEQFLSWVSKSVAKPVPQSLRPQAAHVTTLSSDKIFKDTLLDTVTSLHLGKAGR